MKKLLFIFLIVAAGLSSCTKEGPAGKDGKDGADGRDGNANVQSSEVTVYQNNWVMSNNIYFARFTNSTLTQELVNNGTVLAYYKASNNTFIPLPIPQRGISYAFEVGAITFYTTDQSFTQNTNIFKVVLIGGAPASSVNVNDYNDVADYYGLDDN